ncbi:MAG: GAF domain-containing protein [Elusimicrobia bacterium]|nr:GAF domain-containing protein [Elusimicrobiota bacterium]
MAKETVPTQDVDPYELLAIAGSLNSTLDLDFLLQKIGMAAEKLLDSEASSIMLLDDSKKSLYFKVATGVRGSSLKKMTLELGKGIAGWVALNRQPVTVNDVQSDPRFQGAFDKSSGFRTKSLICVPMITRGELVGVAEVLNKRGGKTYSNNDLGLLTSLANLASVAITNTKLIQDQKNFFSHVLELLGVSVEVSRPGMEFHPLFSAQMACAIGKRMGLDNEEYHSLYYAGLLHDIGYMGAKSRRVLAEIGVIGKELGEEQHPLLSVKMLEGIHMLHGALPMIQHHHERFDGTGFPGRLTGENIPLGARILALVEGLEEMRMRSGLKGQKLIEKATQEAQAGSGKRFDPKVVQVFLELVEQGYRLWEM